MVFGDMGDDSATGVAFTRNPSTGARKIFGEYLVNAQGEDVIAGIRTPQPITKGEGRSARSLEEKKPTVYRDLLAWASKLETHCRDVQDIEFTVEKGRLYLLQTRTGKRGIAAALTIAVDLVREGILDQAEAVRRIDPASLDQVLRPTLDP